MDRFSKILNSFTILIIFSLSVTISCQECQNLLIKSLKDFLKFDPTNPLMSTGKTLNDLGDYNSCNLLEDSKYFLIHTLLDLTTPIVFNLKLFLGVCVPKVCYTEENMSMLKYYIEKYTYAVIKKDEIDIIDPSLENEIVKNYDAYTIIFLVFLIFYILFTVLIEIFVKEESDDEKEILIKAEMLEEEYKFNGNLEKNRQMSSLKSLNVKETEDTEKDIDYAQTSKYMQLAEEKEKLWKNKSKFKAILLCFSITGNWEYISNEQKANNSSHLNVLKGIIVILTVLTICKQLPFLLFNMAMRNPEDVFMEFQSLYYQIFLNVDFTYDYILAFYGFFLAYDQLLRKTGFSFWNLLKNIFFVILKFWFPFIIAFFIYYKFFGYMVGGPIGGYILNKEYKSCKSQTPFIISLLANFTYGKWEKFFPYCFCWNWFIISTVQYSILGLILLHIYRKRRWLFITLISTIISICIILELLILLQNNLGANIYEVNLTTDYFKEYYFKFSTRIFAFFTGFFFGMLFAKYKLRTYPQIMIFFNDIKSSRVISFIFVLIGFSVMVFIVFITHWSYDENMWSANTKLFYNFLSKKVFVLAAFIFVIPLIIGRLKHLGDFLKLKSLVILSELTLSALIISGFVVRLFVLNKVDFFYVSDNYNTVTNCGFIGVTYLLALPFAILFEIPVRRIAIMFCEEDKDTAD